MTNVERGDARIRRRMALHTLNHPPEGLVYVRRTVQNKNTVPNSTNRDKLGIVLAAESAVASIGTIIYTVDANRPSLSIQVGGAVAAGVALVAAAIVTPRNPR